MAAAAKNHRASLSTLPTLPNTLLSFKQGATGEEDFASPEFHFSSMGDRCREQGNATGRQIADAAWESNKAKHNEICMTLQESGWGWGRDTAHKSADTMWGNLAYSGAHDCSLLANVGPLPDGRIHPDDMETLREVGRRIREHGYPAPDAPVVPSRETGAGAA